MPKYRPETIQAKAISLANAYTKSGFNQTLLAEREGVRSQAINQRLKNNPLIKTELRKALDRIGVNTKYKSLKFRELLESKKPIACDVFIRDDKGKLTVVKNENDWIEVEDNPTRLGALKLLCQVDKDLTDEDKPNETHFHLTHIYLPKQDNAQT